MYVSAWPGLNPTLLFGASSNGGVPFPFNASNQLYAYLARNLIYHLFRGLNQRGDTVVLVPDYHHGNEVRALRASGVGLQFYPIRRNLQPDLETLARLCRSGPRVLFVIHYLGWPQPIGDLAQLCRDHGIILVEDCALSLLSESEGRPLGSFGDYSIFCLYKTLPVPNGGMLVQNGKFHDSQVPKFEPCSFPSLLGRTAELVTEWIRTRNDGAGRVLAAVKRQAGQALNSMQIGRLAVGDMGFDRSKVNIDISSLSLNLLPRLDYCRIRQKRRTNFQLLLESLEGRATLLFTDLPEGVCPLFFPILVPDKARAARILEHHGIRAIEFWNQGDPEAAGSSDVDFLRRHVLEIPIHQDVKPKHAAYMAQQILKHKLHF